MKLTIILVTLTLLLCACGVSNPPVRRNPYYKIDAFVAQCECKLLDFNHVAQLTGMSYEDMQEWASDRGYELLIDDGRLTLKVG